MDDKTADLYYEKVQLPLLLFKYAQYGILTLGCALFGLTLVLHYLRFKRHQANYISFSSGEEPEVENNDNENANANESTRLVN